MILSGLLIITAFVLGSEIEAYRWRRGAQRKHLVESCSIRYSVREVWRL